MQLIVPLLRMVYIFLNVFDTFKTLRLPPSSAKNGGKPTARAMSQRKRSMKGCMTVWIVWCCYVIYERTFDPMVRLFVPFYDEIKSISIMFFLVSRARGSEPVFLFVIKPVIKPYAATLDLIFDIAFTVTDFVFLLMTLPFHYVIHHYRRLRYGNKKDVSQEEEEEPVASAVPEAEPAANTTTPIIRSRRTAEEAVDVEPKSRPRSTIHRATSVAHDLGRRESQKVRHAKSTQSLRNTAISQPSDKGTRSSARAYREPTPAPPPYETWYPPPSAYQDTRTISGALPPSEKPPTFEQPSVVPQVQPAEPQHYPSVPVTYPPMPFPVPPRMPAIQEPVTPPRSARSAEVAMYTEIGEESEVSMYYLAEEDQTTPPAKQNFPRSLQSQREYLNLDSVSDWSDDASVSEVHSERGLESMDVDNDDDPSYVEEEEDDFNATFSTPTAKRLAREAAHPRATDGLLSASSADSATSSLGTSDNGSGLRTRTNSQASSMTSSSETSSIAGRKRPFPRTEHTGVKPPRKRPTGKTSPERVSSAQMQARLRGSVRSKPMGPHDSLSSVTADDSDSENDASDVEGNGDVKRQRVSGRPSDRLARPSARREDSDKTIRAKTDRSTAYDTVKVRSAMRKPFARLDDGDGDVQSTQARKLVATADAKTQRTIRR